MPKDERSLGKYLWDVSKTSKETNIVSDLNAFQIELTAAVELANATSLTETYFDPILSATIPLVF